MDQEPYMMPLTDTWEEDDDPTLDGCYEYNETEYYCRRKLVGSLPWGIPTVVVYR